MTQRREVRVGDVRGTGVWTMLVVRPHPRLQGMWTCLILHDDFDARCVGTLETLHGRDLGAMTELIAEAAP